jgi:hypothetical protein
MDDFTYEDAFELDVVESEEDLERLELQDQAETVGTMTPRDFAKLYGVAPQLVYYYIRTKKLPVVYCACGRKTINYNEAKALFDGRGQKIVEVKPDA